MGHNKKCIAVYEQEIDASHGCADPRDFYFQCRDCDRPIRIRMGCGKRFEYFCKVCSKRWQRKMGWRYYQGSMKMRAAKFLTLTLRKQSGNMTKRLMSLWECRKRLFLYLTRAGYEIRSWCAVIEPPNHIHIIVDCDWIPQNVISDLWLKITGDSFIVDIREINPLEDPRKVFAYVTKYMTKAGKWAGMNLDLLRGFHLVGSHNLVVTAKERRAVCVCGSRRPLIRYGGRMRRGGGEPGGGLSPIGVMDWRALIPTDRLLPPGDWTVWIDLD